MSKPRERNPSGAALEETKDMIQKVLETRPHGIPVSDFSAVFQVLAIFHAFHHQSLLTGPQGYKTFFMLNSTEHDISTAHKTKIPTYKEVSCFRSLRCRINFVLS